MDNQRLNEYETMALQIALDTIRDKKLCNLRLLNQLAF